MKKLKINLFHKKEFGRLRTITGEHYSFYNLRDVCRILKINMSVVHRFFWHNDPFELEQFEFGDGSRMNFICKPGLLDLNTTALAIDQKLWKQLYEWCREIDCSEFGREYHPLESL